jgi:Kef-type K+ transport system membrane component KefB
MGELITFFIILIAGLIFSEIFRRLHLPYVTALIIAGVLIGPFFLNIVEINSAIEFIGAIGMAFLMFIAGSEIKKSIFKKIKKQALTLAAFNGLIPFLVGGLIGYIFTQNLFSSLILGTIFMSSSVAVIIPSLEAIGLTKTKIGRSIIASTVLEDLTSLIIFAFILQSIRQTSFVPIPLYLPLLLGVILLLKAIVPKLYEIYHKDKKGKDLFESELRFVFATLLAVVILFELLGVHSIIAGFITGLVLTDSIKGKLNEKIRTLSYGIFIPVFFLIIGMEMDVSVFFSLSSVVLISVVVFGLILSKIISGFIGGKVYNFSNKESLFIGFSTTPQLSTSLAAAFVALELGLLNSEIVSALIVLSIVTTLLSPLLIKWGYNMIKHRKSAKK